MKPLTMKSLLVPSLALAVAACATRPADAPQEPPRKSGPDFADLRLDDERAPAAASEDLSKPLILHVGLAVVTDVIPFVPDRFEPGLPQFGPDETPAEPEPPAPPPVEPEVPAPTR